MSLQSDLYSHLSTYAGLTALVDERIYPLVAPQGAAYPHCVYSIVSNVRSYSHGGYSGLDRVRVQISCYAQDSSTGAGYDMAKAVAAQVIAALENWNNVRVQAARPENEVDLYDAQAEAHYVPVDVFVWYAPG